MSTTRINPTALAGRPCSLAAALQLVGDRWALLVVREVMFGNHQFKQIARNTGAPTDRLSARLKALVEAGLLERRPSPDNSRYQGYHLTEAGRDLSRVTRELQMWGDRWAVTAPPLKLRHGDHELTTQTVCTTCNAPVHSDEVDREMAVPQWDMAGPAAPRGD